MNVWVVNWKEKDYEFSTTYRRARKTFTSKLRANEFADFLRSYRYTPLVWDVYISKF